MAHVGPAAPTWVRPWARRADNYIALHVDGEYDQLLENIRKTEIAICLREVASSAGRKIDVAFANEYAAGPKWGAIVPTQRVLAPTAFLTGREVAQVGLW